ncbi:MAG TPA: GTPase, partial [Nitrospiraceae bacterium]|nr:GTPase [Nitrospiraceae bacterium]
MKSGTVAIIGRPNVGKSTLLNAVLKEKIAIVSDKPQTTRTRILGVAHLAGAQVVFLDTPGLHRPQHLLNKRMVRTALDTMRAADLLYVMVEATSLPGPRDRIVVEQVREVNGQGGKPSFLLIN